MHLSDTYVGEPKSLVMTWKVAMFTTTKNCLGRWNNFGTWCVGLEILEVMKVILYIYTYTYKAYISDIIYIYMYRFNSGCLRSFARNPSFDRFHPVFFDEVLGSWRSGHYFCCCCCGGRGGGAGAGAGGGGWWFSIPIKIQQKTFSTQLEGPSIAWRPLLSSKVGSELGTATVRKKKHIIWRLTFCYYKIWTAISSGKNTKRSFPVLGCFGMFWAHGIFVSLLFFLVGPVCP